jgi:hypothetical protein
LDANESTKVNIHNSTTKTLSVTGSHNYKKGDILVVIAQDCSQATVMVNETTPATPSTGTITYTTASSTTANYLNCNLLHIAGNYDCDSTISATPAPPIFSFAQGASVYKIHRTLLALKTKAGVDSSSLVEIDLLSGSEIELVRGISFVDFTYGISEESAAYNITLAPSATPEPSTYQRISKYMTATQIENDAVVQWSDVISVRALITLQSLSAIQSSARVVGSDNHAIRQFSFIFPIRNQMVR